MGMYTYISQAINVPHLFRVPKREFNTRIPFEEIMTKLDNTDITKKLECMKFGSTLGQPKYILKRANTESHLP